MLRHKQSSTFTTGPRRILPLWPLFARVQRAAQRGESAERPPAASSVAMATASIQSAPNGMGFLPNSSHISLKKRKGRPGVDMKHNKKTNKGRTWGSRNYPDLLLSCRQVSCLSLWKYLQFAVECLCMFNRNVTYTLQCHIHCFERNAAKISGISKTAKNHSKVKNMLIHCPS